jgi:hypothetical protein
MTDESQHLVDEIIVHNIPISREFAERVHLAETVNRTYREMKWTTREAAKQCDISEAESEALFLKRNIVKFSNEDLMNIVHSLKRKEAEYLYINDVRTHLAFLYAYCDVVGDMRAFGATDEGILHFIGDRCLDRHGYELTLRGIVELGIFHLADLMFRFERDDNYHLLPRVESSEYYSKVAVRKVANSLLVIPVQELLEAEKVRADCNQESAEELEKIKSSYQNRQDVLDKKTFQEWCKNESVVIEKIQEIESMAGFPLSINYAMETLKNWYKEAMPHVELKGGRPAKQKK